MELNDDAMVKKNYEWSLHLGLENEVALLMPFDLNDIAPGMTDII